jgi:dynein heavy chain
MDRFDNIMEEFNKKFFATVEDYQTLAEMELNIFTDFCSGNDSEYPPYLPVRDSKQLKGVLEAQLTEHNETNAAMNLVLFTDAMEHISRIARIIRQPRGNALLVGVGGSGKQSLSKLAAFICKFEVFSITVTSSYKVADFKENLQTIYMKAGVKGVGVLFLFTDQQIIDERFLVLLNDLLSSGDIPDLFPAEEIDNISNAIRSEVKQAGLMDTKEVVWDFFIEKVRKYLHLALCFSPVGDKFRVRARQFPALVSCTQIDWFHPWSQEALVAVAQTFLADLEGWEDELKENMANHMATVHASVTIASEAFLATERRRNYTTPKSFLELIALYKSMLHRKLEEIGKLKERLESGLEKLQATAEMVAELQEALKNDMALVEEKKAATDALLVHVGQETEIANGEKEKASVEEDAADTIAREVAAFQEGRS